MGADAVVASGLEAGGHRGTFLGDWDGSQIGTMALVPACVDALRIPVIAAGGIMDGRGITAALALGAQAVQLGTAFLACPESAITPAQRAAMTGAQASDTRLTRIFSGRPARGILNDAMRALAPHEADIPAYPIQNALMGPVRRAAAQAGDAGHIALWAGQGVGAARALAAGVLLQALEQEWRASPAEDYKINSYYLAIATALFCSIFRIMVPRSATQGPTMYMSSFRTAPHPWPLQPQRGEGDRLRRYYSLSLWERAGVRACGSV